MTLKLCVFLGQSNVERPFGNCKMQQSRCLAETFSHTISVRLRYSQSTRSTLYVFQSICIRVTRICVNINVTRCINDNTDIREDQSRHKKSEGRAQEQWKAHLHLEKDANFQSQVFFQIFSIFLRQVHNFFQIPIIYCKQRFQHVSTRKQCSA